MTDRGAHRRPRQRLPWRGLFVLGIGIVLAIVAMTDADAQQPDPVHVLTIDGDIDRSDGPYVQRSVRDAEDAGAAALVILLDTASGQLHAALQMRDALLESAVPTVAFIDGSAQGSGALVAIASDRIVFGTDAALGAADPARVASGGAQTGDTKVVEAVRGIFADTAQARGREAAVASAMVDPSVAVDDLVDGTRLLALDAAAAEAAGYLDGQADGLDDALEVVGLADAALSERDRHLGERAVKWLTHPLIAASLLTAGVLLLLGEIFLGAFGVVSLAGVAALGAFFYGHALAGMAGWEDVTVMLIGFALIALEIFVVPGFGVPGVLGMAGVLGGAWLTMVGPDLEVVTTGAMVSTAATIVIAFDAITVGIIALLALGSRKRKEDRDRAEARGEGAPGEPDHEPAGWLKWFGDGDRLAHDDDPAGLAGDGGVPDPVDEGAPLSTAAAAASRQGAVGVAASDLRPAGIAEFDGFRVDVVTLGDYLEKGETVEVVRAERYRRVVRRARTSSTPHGADEPGREDA